MIVASSKGSAELETLNNEAMLFFQNPWILSGLGTYMFSSQDVTLNNSLCKGILLDLLTSTRVCEQN